MLKTYLPLIMRIPISFFNEGVHIWHNNCLWFVKSEYGYNHLGQKSNNLKICRIAINVNSS